MIYSAVSDSEDEEKSHQTHLMIIVRVENC